MNSKLNNAGKRKLTFVSFNEGEKNIEFPPLTTNEYPFDLAERYLREEIAKHPENFLNIKLEENKKEKNKETDKGDK